MARSLTLAPVLVLARQARKASGAIVVVLDAEESSVDVLVALVHSVELELLEDPPGRHEPGVVGRGVVGQVDLHSLGMGTVKNPISFVY